MRRLGFTLSEVLITLGIIGIVAGLTLPGVIQKQRNRANVARLQKTYSILSQALLRAKEEQGDYGTWPVNNSAEGAALIFSYIEPYMKIVKKCGNKTTCWATDIKSLSGESAKWIGIGGDPKGVYSFVLSDGTSVMVDVFGELHSCIGVSSSDLRAPFIGFWVDVNGGRNPNMFGRDVFGFALANKGLVPFGYANNSTNCNPKIKANDSGYGCTFKVLQERAINY